MAELLCLAYSRKYSARCVAGIRLDTLEWVRPVSNFQHGALSAAACRLDVGRAPQVLDVIDVPLKRAAPEAHQPENWTVTDREWRLVEQLSVDDAHEYLDEVLVLVDGAIDAAGLYVPMTRGRDGNDVWVVMDPSAPSDAVDMLAEVMQRRWIDEPAIDRLPAAEIGLD